MKNYSQKLRDCMAEIEQVCKKHDCMAFVALTGKEHSEFKLLIEDPTWSTARWVKDGEAMHLKIYNKSMKAETTSTIGSLYSLRDLCGLMFMQLDKLAAQVEQQVKVKHIPFGKNGITNEDR